MIQPPLPAAARRAFADLFEHLAHGRDGRPWCRYALDAEAKGYCLKLDLAGSSALGPLLETMAVALSSWSVSCRTRGAHWSQPNVIARVSAKLASGSTEAELQRRRFRLLESGLMAGLLHPRSDLPALTAPPDRRPFRTRSTFLSLRYAIAADTIFFMSDEMKAAHAAWLERRANQDPAPSRSSTVKAE